jgi:superfamily II DNA or RNA helicase
MDGEPARAMDPHPFPILRYSSRRARLDLTYLASRLARARAYDRIAGYFSSSILEAAGEPLESVAGPIRLVCNSGLHPRDVVTARAAQAALRQEWCTARPESLVEPGGAAARDRFARLHEFLRSGRLDVRVLPDEVFGLIHGKAGVITMADGRRTSFLGSVNETRSGWQINYELLWEDPSPEAVAWVQEEFDALWGSPHAIPLAQVEFIVEDIGRIARRRVIRRIEDWRPEPASGELDPAPAFIEAPVYREQVGLWEHQKAFVKLAFDAHVGAQKSARFVLADQVGLGKTVQLGMVAQLVALTGNRPILILAPKILLWQWQTELSDLLAMPSAVWNGRQWVDEQGIEYPAIGPTGIRRCPRRVGIVSAGLITRRSEACDHLKNLRYDLVIVDEAHRARRTNREADATHERAEPNNLLAFLRDLSTQTRSMLLATATPVQMDPVEAWDLLDVLAGNNDFVLGNMWSKWRDSRWALGIVSGKLPAPKDEDAWEWIRNPLPTRSEGKDLEILRRSLGLDDRECVAPGNAIARLRPPERARLRTLARTFFQDHNPFIRHIVRRTRGFLENTRDATGEPFLKPIGVELLGEDDLEAIFLPAYLKEAYEIAEEFTQLLGNRMTNAGFLKTMLLRRVGSTMAAGRITAERLLGTWDEIVEDEEEEENAGEESNEASAASSISKSLTQQERLLLQRFVEALEANHDRDPKYAVVHDCLVSRRWLDRGCIVFSQYYDSLRWLAESLVHDLPGVAIGLYAGAGKSGLMRVGEFIRTTREQLKAMVRAGELRLLLGTDAASEGLNLQVLGTLINLDLPWNPTRLEQRKGRIQRIGQIHDVVQIYNMRYKGSVEDRVHHLLSQRLREIYDLFGQIPDVLEDVWVQVALGAAENAKAIIDAVPPRHPFNVRHEEKAKVERIAWERCEVVLDDQAKREALKASWISS